MVGVYRLRTGASRRVLRGLDLAVTTQNPVTHTGSGVGPGAWSPVATVVGDDVLVVSPRGSWDRTHGT